MSSPSPSPRRTAFLVLAYVPLAGVVPLLFEKTDREIRWHARNGLILFAAVAGIALAATLLGIVVPALTCAYGILMFFVLVVYAIVGMLAIVKALQGQRLIVPGLSRYAG
ncbi:MAG: hypothetical protein ABR576_07990 [Thermoanaerobaculia bacterium]